MRAATALAPLLTSTIGQIWRADDVAQKNDAGVVPSGSLTLDVELPGGGWPQGALTEILVDSPGQGELSLLMPAIAQMTRTGRPCIWTLPWSEAAHCASESVNGPASGIPLPYAPALAAAGVDLDRTIFVQPATPREGLWALEQSLRMPHLGVLIGWLPDSARGQANTSDADFRALRRLHLLASRHQALVFVLRRPQAAAAPSPASLRLQLHCREGKLDITVLKRRGRPLLEPVTLQVYPSRWNDAQVATAPSPAIIPPQRAPLPAPALPERRWSLHALLSH
jgi:cell division inhibitor SulA/protein ImuA